MRGPLVVVLLVVVAVAVAAARAGARPEHVTLKPNGARITAAATLTERGVEVRVGLLPVGAPVAANISLYSCSAGTSAGWGYADSHGDAHWSATLPVTWAQAHDGRHVLSVSSDGRTMACAAIPATHPAHVHHWGIWSFALRFTD